MVVLLLIFWKICMPLFYHFVLLWLCWRELHTYLSSSSSPRSSFSSKQNCCLPLLQHTAPSFGFQDITWLLMFLQIYIESKYLMTSCCPARCICSLLESLESLCLLFGTTDRHVLAWVFTLTELPSPDVSSLRTSQNTFFSPWRSRNHRKCMCVTGLEVSCSGNIKRTLGSSISVQDTVYSYRDKWMWWVREKRSVASLFLVCRAWNRQAGLEGWIGLHWSSVGCWQVGWTRYMPEAGSGIHLIGSQQLLEAGTSLTGSLKNTASGSLFWRVLGFQPYYALPAVLSEWLALR